MDSLLCFLSSAKNDFSCETLYNIVDAFYSHENIKAAKVILVNLLHKDIVWRRDPEKKKKDLSDVCELLNELLSSEKRVKFVCDTYKGMPPVGFEYIAPIITNLCSDISKLNDLLPKILDIKSEVTNTADTVRQLRIDVGDMKMKFGNASDGLQTASEVAQDDLEIISDLRSFRNSIGNLNGAVGGIPIDSQEQNEKSFASIVRNEPKKNENRNNKNKRKSSSQKNNGGGAPELVANPLPGAISKDRLPSSGKTRKQNDTENHHVAPNEVRHTSDDTTSVNSESGVATADADNNGWKIVQRKRNKFRVMGARKDNNSLVKAVKRTADVFLGRVDTDVQIVDIESYIKDVFNVSVEKIENLKIKSDQFSAFKITVLLDERDKLFDCELWPEGMVVNKFYNRRG